MSWVTPLTDVVISEEEIAVVLECLAGGWVTMGPLTQQFEAAFAALYDQPHAVAVSSGTAALHLALLAAGLQAGDEVLVPTMTFVAGAAAVRYCGASPLFVESCGAADLNMDPDDAARQIGPQTRAILATNWMGYACDLTALERLCADHGLLLIEDCAQSVIARSADGRLTGTVGAAGCLSFFSKNQLSVGEGGMIITADEQLAAKARLFRSHAMTSATWDRHLGYAESYDVVDLGFNFRIDEPRAALGLARLESLIQTVERRRAVVRRYRERLGGLPGITVPWTDAEVERGSHFGFPIVLDTQERRDLLVHELQARRIQTTSYPALTTLSGYRDHPRRPRTEDLAARHVVLPLSSTFSQEQIDTVIDHVTEIVATGAQHRV